ncbi:YrhK family protein [Pantoea sp. FN060301]|uniref:YrhK family protein n=1 Tax=Pantoea sp. FN060301 TaxID=3420380 RepID=UPI003D16E6AB
MCPNKTKIDLGSDRIVIEKRYRALSALNDLLIGIWFLAGSILFFYDSLMTVGTWFFVAGSVELIFRPVIKLTELIHVKRFSSRDAS